MRTARHPGTAGLEAELQLLQLERGPLEYEPQRRRARGKFLSVARRDSLGVELEVANRRRGEILGKIDLAREFRRHPRCVACKRDHRFPVHRERFAGRERPGREHRDRHLVARARLAILEAQQRIGEPQSVHALQRESAAIVGAWLPRRVVAEPFPVARTVRQLHQVDPQAVEPERADLEPPGQQRQQLRPDRGGADLDERLGAEAGRVAEPHPSDLQAEPGEHAQRDLSLDLEAAAGLFLHRPGDVVAVVVRIDEQRHENDRCKHKHDEDPEQAENDLENSGHR